MKTLLHTFPSHLTGDATASQIIHIRWQRARNLVIDPGHLRTERSVSSFPRKNFLRKTPLTAPGRILSIVHRPLSSSYLTFLPLSVCVCDHYFLLVCCFSFIGKMGCAYVKERQHLRWCRIRKVFCGVTIEVLDF